MNKIRKYTAGLLSVLCLSAASCDVLDVEPTGSYSETTAYSSLSNLDLYVKYFYGVLYANADIACGSSCLMDDGATDLEILLVRRIGRCDEQVFQIGRAHV